MYNSGGENAQSLSRLDGVVAKQLQSTLDTLSTDATTICITHHLEDLKNTDLILYLDGGKIVERGSFEELAVADGEFSKQLAARGHVPAGETA